MKVRETCWYRKEAEIFDDCFTLLLDPWVRAPWVPWEPFSFLDPTIHVPTREEFEKYYLEWKAQNEG